jgi:integrase/recombinase XerD
MAPVAHAIAVDATPALLVDGYLATLQSGRSHATMGESLRRITRLLGAGDDERAFPWHRLGFDEMHSVRDRLANAYPPATANLSLSAMRQMLKIGHVRGLVTDEQRRAVDLVKNVRGNRLVRGRALTDAELEALWVHCRSVNGARGAQVRALLTVFVGAGLRREEVCGLLVSGCRGDELHVVGKGNKERAVPIDEWTSTQLGEWLSARRQIGPHHGCVFCTLGRPGAPPFKVWTLWFTVREMAARAGLVDERGRPTLAPHDFRRTFASRLLEQGFDLSEVQRLLGHENVATTQRYDKRGERKLAEKRRGVVLFAFADTATAGCAPSTANEEPL